MKKSDKTNVVFALTREQTSTVWICELIYSYLALYKRGSYANYHNKRDCIEHLYEVHERCANCTKTQNVVKKKQLFL